MMAGTPAICRAEVVGSLVRPQALIDARARFRAGKLAADEYRAIEDRAVDDALALQEEVGMDVVTDGELRRDIFFGFLVSAVNGLAPLQSGVVRFHNDLTSNAMEVPIPFSVVDRVVPLPCPAVNEFRYAAERTSLPIKVTLPSPMLSLGFWSRHSRAAYADPFDLAYDVAEIVKGWMRELAGAGCRYIQIDAPELNEVCLSAEVRRNWAEIGVDPEHFIDVGAELLGALGDLELPGVIKGLHVCKGNGTQSWIATGGYGAFIDRALDRLGGYQVLHFEFDDERSGGFEPLARLPDDTTAVLGLVSTKWTRMEDPDALCARVAEAAVHHPLDRLALAPQCGFASAGETAATRKLLPETQRAKLKLVAEVARRVWG